MARAYARTLYGYDPRPRSGDRRPRHRQRPPALGRPAHLHLHPARRGPLRPPGQPRGHRPGLHHRHPAALRQDHPVAGAAVRGPDRRRQPVRRREGQPHLGAGRPSTPAPSPSPWTSRPATSCRSSPSRCSRRCQGSTRPAMRSGANYDGPCGRLRPVHRGHLRPRPVGGAGPQPQLGSRHRPAAQGLGGPDPGQARRWTPARPSRRSSGRRPTCRWTATCPRRRSPPSRPIRSDPSGCRSTTSECLLYLTLGTHRAAGAIADVRVRQAVNYAIDKVAYRDAISGPAAAGRRAGLHHPGPGLARLPPLRPVPDPGWPGRPGQGQGPARRGRLPQRADPGALPPLVAAGWWPPESRSRNPWPRPGSA